MEKWLLVTYLVGMIEMMIDLRSDTVTQPTDAMQAAMAGAELGDDVFGDDPTVQRLEQATADLLGKEAAIFMPSGTMTNQIAVRIHCQPGDEFLCETTCHIYNMEQGAFAQLSGVVGRPIDGELGILDVAQLKSLVRPDDVHQVRTKLVLLENTHNRGGGKIFPYASVVEICDWAHQCGLKTHLDGARLFNAVVASENDAAEWSSHFDTVSICFSKGLGAPVGSALAGPADAILEARRHRKAFGGGMRQAGVIAAGALYALENNIERLSDDHANAQILAQAVNAVEGLSLRDAGVDTNIVFFLVDPALGTAAEFSAALRREGILINASAPDTLRAVTHLGLSASDVQQVAAVLSQLAGTSLSA